MRVPGLTEYVPIEELREDPENANDHGGDSIPDLRASIRRFGQQKSISAKPDGTVIAGNGFLRAMREEGQKLVLVTWTGLDGTAARAYAIADNQTAKRSRWNESALGAALRDGVVDEFFRPDEVAALLAPPEDPKEKPEVLLGESVALEPEREYVVVMCRRGEAGAMEFAELRQRLGLDLVRRGGYRDGSPLDAVGVQRVIPAAALLALTGFADLVRDEVAFSRATFPEATDQSTATHLRREAVELEAAPDDVDEMADVLLLLIALAGRRNVDLVQVAREKLAKNQARKWADAPDAEGVREHVR